MTDEARAAELREAWSAFEAEQFERAISLAAPYLERPGTLGVEATRISGLARFRSGDYATAVQDLRRVADAVDNAENWFNLGTTSIMAGEMDTARLAIRRAFDAAVRPGQGSGTISVPQMRYYFAHALADRREYRLALEQLNALRAMYEQLRITDDTFVYIRGVPMLGHTMELALIVFRGLGPDFPARQWIAELAARVDEDGAKLLREYAARLDTRS